MSGFDPRSFYETWYLKAVDPTQNRSLRLCITILVSGNGFRRLAEATALLLERKPDGEVDKHAFKQSHDIAEFKHSGDNLYLGTVTIDSTKTAGVLHSKGRELKWDLKISARAGLTPEDLRLDGTITLDGRQIDWSDARGMRGHSGGRRRYESWHWAHCNAFTDTRGGMAPVAFEAECSRKTLFGSLRSPRVCQFNIFYEGRTHSFHTIKDILHLRSQLDDSSWTFRAERGDLAFRGEIKSLVKNCAGLTYEDTNGSYVYATHSDLSEMTLLVYRKGKLENTFKAENTASYEAAARDKNSYITYLI